MLLLFLSRNKYNYYSLNDTYVSFIEAKCRNNTDGKITQKEICGNLMKEEIYISLRVK